MKKTISILALCFITMVSMLGLTGCGDSDNVYDGLDLDQYVKVGQYKGLKAEKISVKVEKADIGDEISAALEAAAKDEKIKKGEAVENGDTVNINYTGRIDGKKFSGGSAEKQDLEIGSGSFIDGFEDGLIGHAVGEKGIELNLAFPLDYQAEDLQGKDVVFTVDINSATRSVKPEYNDEFVKSQGDYANTEEYEKAVKEKLYDQKKQEAKKDQQGKLWNQVLEASKVKQYPQDVLDKYVECFDSQIDFYAEQYGTDRETLMAQTYGVSNEKELKKMLTKYAKVGIKQELVLESIAEKEDITYSDDEAEQARQMIEAQGYDEESVERDTGKTMDQLIRQNLLYDKVFKLLVDNAKIK